MKKKLSLKKEIVVRLDEQSMVSLNGGYGITEETAYCQTDLDCPTCCGESCNGHVICAPEVMFTCAHKTCPDQTLYGAECISVQCETPTLVLTCGIPCLTPTNPAATCWF